MSDTSHDVAVIGGGLLGWSTAYQLLRRGLSVDVYERGDPGQATAAGAGIIAPGTSLTAEPEVFPLARFAVDFYQGLIDQLSQETTVDPEYEPVGEIFIARDEHELATLPQTEAEFTRRRDAGMANIGELTMLSGNEARQYFPALAEIPGAIHLSGPARANGAKLRDALKDAALLRGAELIGKDAKIVRTGNRVDVAVNGVAVHSERVVVTGGAWSPALADAVGEHLPIYPQRGQIAHLKLPGTDPSAWPIVGGYFTHYIVTFRPDRIVAGATREHGSGFDVRMTAGGVHEALGNALAIAPGLHPATITEIKVGLRPYCADRIPVIGPSSTVENLWYCTGHGPSGLQLGPYSGALIAGMVTGEAAPLDLAPFSPSRFQTQV